jgi:hypothetical protein
MPSSGKCQKGLTENEAKERVMPGRAKRGIELLMCIKTSRKTKVKVARSGRGGPAENESLKLETEEQRQEPVEQNRETGQNPPRVVAP